ncbi:SMI1/KNR4 family protein [Lysinibacillus mangiferihumi]|uniref:SMI1/KNR4 family protein n=1 Tax=Lysinibacillus mangiferihumi TaxID=1130819 RepID=A0A4U2YJE8_9BACI|nr:SMI1/KNR4 family protein [Lysinibacillus mangiferihumi]TKI61248.1 SMI1/KNR4 family protein [Lysinibacillus mangiferihumi]
MKFAFIKNNTTLQFTPINSDEIEHVEGELGITFPNELKLLLMEIGYGSFIGEDELDENCILSPSSIRDFRLRQGYFEAFPRYDEINKLIFFIGWESVPFSIELTEEQQNPVYNNKNKIANSLEEFLLKISENPEYYQPD